MPSEFPMNDPQKIWQNQPTEPLKMSADEMRGKAQQRRKKARLEALRTIAIGILLCIFFAWTFTRAHAALPRMGLGLLSLWGMYVSYQAYRWIWPGGPRPEAAASTSVEFYRSELEKSRDYGLHVWRRAGLTFCFLGLAMVVVPGVVQSLATPRLMLNFVPLFALLAIWFAMFFPMRKRKLRKLQQEIDELRALEREGQP